MYLNKIRKAAPLFGVFLLAYIVYSTGIESIAEAFFRLQPIYLIPTFIMLFLYLAFQTIKWRQLLSYQGIRLDFAYLFKAYLVGVFWGMITPGRIGTLVRAKHLMRKTKKDLGKCMTSVVLDKALDILAIFVVGIACIFFVARNVVGVPIVMATVVLFVVFVALIFLFSKESLSKKVMRLFHRFFIPAKLKEEAKATFHSFYRELPPPKKMVLPFLLTAIAWIFAYGASYFVALSLGIDVPFTVFILFSSIATIISLVPVTIGGLGTREATLITLFSLFQIAPEAVIVMSIMAYLMTSILPAIAGGWLSVSWSRKGM